MTRLDELHAAMQAGTDPSAALRFYEGLAETELIVLLVEEPVGGAEARPALFPTGDGTLALVFDAEDRLTTFSGGPAAYAALPGRALVGMLAGQGIGLGLNLDVAPSSFLLDAAGVDWLAGMLAGAPEPRSARPVAVRPPALPETLVAALDRKLARAEGLARHALLAAADWPEGGTRHLLAVVGAIEGAEPALAQAIAEAVAFSGVEVPLDVMFLAPGDRLAETLARQGLRFDLPDPPAPPAPVAPGSDPDRPPRLR